jgi:hypothetical protein
MLDTRVSLATDILDTPDNDIRGQAEDTEVTEIIFLTRINTDLHCKNKNKKQNLSVFFSLY